MISPKESRKSGQRLRELSEWAGRKKVHSVAHAGDMSGMVEVCQEGLQGPEWSV